jgi:hypothetical protein
MSRVANRPPIPRVWYIDLLYDFSSISTQVEEDILVVILIKNQSNQSSNYYNKNKILRSVP